jgi:hypothetical protein
MFKTKKLNTDYRRTKSFGVITGDFGYENFKRGMLPFTYKVVADRHANLKNFDLRGPLRKMRVEISCTDHEYKNYAAAMKLERAKELVEAESLSFPDLWKLVERYKDVYCAYPLNSEESYLSAMGDLWHLRTQIRIGLLKKWRRLGLVYKLEEVMSEDNQILRSKYLDVYKEFLPEEEWEKVKEKLGLEKVKSYTLMSLKRITFK